MHTTNLGLPAWGFTFNKVKNGMSYKPKTAILNSFFLHCIAWHGIASIHSFIQSFSNIYGTPPTSGPVLPSGKTLVIKSGMICMALKQEM